MQDWREQAKSKGIDILDFGDCQFCGAPLDRGVSQCVDLFGNIPLLKVVMRFQKKLPNYLVIKIEE